MFFQKPLTMIFKESRPLVSCQCGVYLVKIFHIYNKLSKKMGLGFFGLSSNQIVSNTKYFLKKKKKKKFFIRSVAKQQYLDGSSLSFSKNYVVLLKKRLYIKGISTFGPIPYTIKRKKAVASFTKKI
jgi:ribosomal protein L14